MSVALLVLFTVLYTNNADVFDVNRSKENSYGWAFLFIQLEY